MQIMKGLITPKLDGTRNDLAAEFIRDRSPNEEHLDGVKRRPYKG